MQRFDPPARTTPPPPPRIGRLAETYFLPVLNQPRIFATKSFMNETLLLRGGAAVSPDRARWSSLITKK
jgi:hypothetical protein